MKEVTGIFNQKTKMSGEIDNRIRASERSDASEYAGVSGGGFNDSRRWNEACHRILSSLCLLISDDNYKRFTPNRPESEK